MSLAPADSEAIEVVASFYPLGCLVAYAKVHDEGRLAEAFDFGRVTPTRSGALQEVLGRLPEGPEVYLFSNYVWNEEINSQFASLVKRHQPASLVVVGGPQVPREPEACRAFFERHSFVDVAVRNEGEVTLAEILDVIARTGSDKDLPAVDLSTVAGITFRRRGDLVRTDDRSRTRDLGIFPSPYTTGEYDHWLRDKLYIPIETNRGCPYGCTFCDWGAATLSKVSRLSMERVLGEIEFAGKQRIHTIGVCDANFGILPRDVDIVRHVIDVRDKYGYPRRLGYSNAKTASPRLTEIIKLLRDADLTAAAQISMQTTDQRILDNVERANIKTSEYRKMIAFFHEEDIPAISDMMLGLPGQTPRTWQKDLQFCFDHKVGAVIFATSVMPNAPMADAEYRRRFQISVDSDGFVESTYSFTPEEYRQMFDLSIGYKFFLKLGLLRYFLYFVQIEHGLEAMEFIGRWMRETVAHPERYPVSSRVRRQLLDRDYKERQKDWLVLVWTDQQASFLFDSLDEFYAEILAFVSREHGLYLEGNDVEAVLAANREVMPRRNRNVPDRVELPHDVPGYFATLRMLPRLDELPPGHRPLSAWGPGYLELPEQPVPSSYAYMDLHLQAGRLELASNLRI